MDFYHHYICSSMEINFFLFKTKTKQNFLQIKYNGESISFCTPKLELEQFFDTENCVAASYVTIPICYS